VRKFMERAGEELVLARLAPPHLVALFLVVLSVFAFCDSRMVALEESRRPAGIVEPDASLFSSHVLVN